MAAPRPYGRGSYGSAGYGTGGATELGGVAQIAFGAQGDMIRTWQQPTQMCSTGTWTLTTLPTGPINDELLLA